MKLLNLDKLHWIVTKKNPFKKKPFFSLNASIHKSKTITKKNKKIKVSYLDDKIRSTKTIKVVNYLVKKNKNCTFFLIIGSDSLVNFHRWNQWRKIAKFCKIVVFSRKGYTKKAEKSAIIKYLNKNNIIYIKNFNEPYSSSQIRKKYLN